MNLLAPISSAETELIKSPAELLQEQIRARAYEIYELRGREHGYDVDDWLQAEIELLQQRAKAASA